MKNSDFIDVINLLSFIVSILNYQVNLTQTDKQDILDEFNNKLHTTMELIEQHLANQDKKIDQILELLKNQ